MINIYTTYRRIDFADADPAGIMFFGNIFRIAHAAFEEFLLKSDCFYDYFNSDKYLFPLVHCDCDFFNPAKPGETVRIDVGCIKTGRTSFEIGYEICMETEGMAEVPVARAKTIHASVSKSEFKKTAVPGFLKLILNPPVK